MLKKLVFLSVSLLFPFLAFAQGTGTLQSLIVVIGNIATMLTSILSVLAFVVFFYGLAIYVLNAGNEEKKEEGKAIMLWGTIALFVLVTIWGIIGLLQKTVGNTNGPTGVNIVVPRF